MALCNQADKARTLRDLHQRGNPVVFVNAWDAISARIIESLGYPAVATTSAGVAFSEGYPDGEKIPREVMIAGIKRVARAVTIPVSADSEAGYGPTPEDAATTARGVLEAGAVGMNFEDSIAHTDLMAIEAQEARIRAIRAAGAEREVPIVINARTDACFVGERDQENEADVAEAILRGNRYLAAGADCIFVPGVTSTAVIERLVNEINGPVNILAVASSPSLSTMRDLGVSRISLGSGPIGYAMAAYRNLAADLREGTGDVSFLSQIMPHSVLNGLLAPTP
jgi:2-methylisocitrate lyase-like PEP mutase family enzyme